MGRGPPGDGLLLLPDLSERCLMHSAFDYAGIMGISIRLLGPVCQQEVDEVWRFVCLGAGVGVHVIKCV